MAPTLELFEASPLAMEFLDGAPPVVRGEPDVRAVYYCQAREMERMDAWREELRAELFPKSANRNLPGWEALLRLPGIGTVAYRQEQVINRLAALNADPSGRNWVERVQARLGANVIWAYEETGYQLREAWYGTAPGFARSPGPTGITVGGGSVRITPQTTYPKLSSIETVDLTGDAAVIVPLIAAGGGVTTESGITVSADADDYAQLFIWTTELLTRLVDDGASTDTNVTFNPAVHKFLRFSYAAPDLVWETAETLEDAIAGTSLVTLRSEAPGFPIDALTVELYAGYYGADTGLSDAEFGPIVVTRDDPVAAHTVRIFLPFADGSYELESAKLIFREETPAEIDLNFGDTAPPGTIGSFLLDVSEMDDDIFGI